MPGADRTWSSEHSEFAWLVYTSKKN
uniref:Uncharacterized protein n=1 Tax=Anguilla anguilla TaxID=7936 RepID=A0A0E9PFU6_ANGAN